MLHCEFVVMPSGWQYYVSARKSNRYTKSYMPSAMALESQLSVLSLDSDDAVDMFDSRCQVMYLSYSKSNG